MHGDDPCIVDGKDVYETAQKLGNLIALIIYSFLYNSNVVTLVLVDGLGIFRNNGH